MGRNELFNKFDEILGLPEKLTRVTLPELASIVVAEKPVVILPRKKRINKKGAGPKKGENTKTQDIDIRSILEDFKVWDYKDNRSGFRSFLRVNHNGLFDWIYKYKHENWESRLARAGFTLTKIREMEVFKLKAYKIELKNRIDENRTKNNETRNAKRRASMVLGVK